ncbi:MAG: hypothetical protein AB7O29_08750 [Acidimicrobiia bacterium]
MPGPLPDPNRRRRNAPTIPPTDLPAAGRKGLAPRVPAGYELGGQGLEWWGWAWHTPQASGWSAGDLFLIARRAQLEDDAASLEAIGFEPPPCDDEAVADWLKDVKRVVQILKALAGGRLAIMKEMREIDDRLGLTPKGLAALRWKIVEEEAKAPATVRQLRAVAGGASDPRRSLGG